MIQAVSLFVVLLCARLLTIVGHEAGLAFGVAPIAHGVFEDALIASSLALFDAVLRRPRWTWALYVLLAAVAAADVPVARTLGTPVTPVMLRGARVALADSILTHVTVGSVLRVLGVVGMALLAPLVSVRLWAGTETRRAAAVGAVAFVALLGVVVPGSATPFHRNSIVALVRPMTAAAAPVAGIARTSTSPEASYSGEDLSALRGTGKGRNVLLVVLESTGSAPLGLHGAAGEDPMPRLAELALDGVVFDNAYSTFPESIRSQVAYWDSRHPGVGEMPEDLAKPTSQPLPARMKDAGYRTALVHSGHFDYLGMQHVVEGRGFDVLEDAGDIGGARATSFGVDEETAVARVLEWIDEAPGEPWFAAYLPIAGHHPYDTPRPGPFSSGTAEGQYRNALRYADESVGMLLDGLVARGVLENTVVVVTGDHGEAFGEHPGNHGHTFQLYDENVHVPLVVSLPGRVVGRRISRVASHVDLAPTITDLLGIEADARWEGGSLLRPESRVALFATDWAERLIGLRDGRYKFVLSLDSGDAQLFDVVTDPGEQTNLAETLPERADRYRQLLRP